MRRRSALRGLFLAVILAACAGSVSAVGVRPRQWARLSNANARLHGTIVDFTHNHGADRRIYSPSLCERRDLYVYLPPCYDVNRAYPAMILLHGIAQDEQFFLGAAELFDQAMACGDLPPFIVAVPDGSIAGVPKLLNSASFYLNTRAGRFEDYIICDIWNFVRSSFNVRPEREFHMLCGGSAGGFGAYNIGFKHRCDFKILAGFLPALNLRYQDCHGRYFAPFDPSCTGLIDHMRPWKPVARFYGVVAVRQKALAKPLFGRDRDAIRRLAEENPVEMLDRLEIRPDEFDMFVGYSGRDEFNMKAQCESFVYAAARRGVGVTTAFDPQGHHTSATAKRLFPAFVSWLGPLLRCYEQSVPAPAATHPSGRQPA
jgi:S-formylglutathione hydrolase FrmB